ncbi:UPF0481 protein At3g47200-like [Neltuma alba]|uniref:UPF0481 protein At3g47200-like n=1 Tax=Neltuma alba TaxID=207710 RepID=UPI0010A4B456|nr:UPF0481 protein At3g47200-like [Prosopis alba]
MEKFKSTYVKNFLERVRIDGLLEDYLRTLTGLEDRIRKCYAEQVEMRSDKFLRMIITDSCFIFEYFLRLVSDQQWAVEDYVLLKPWLVGAIHVDLILLENQIPFFVLKELYNMAIPSSGTPFPELTLTFFNDLKVNKVQHNAIVEIERVEHFTHLIREFFLPPTKERLFKRETSIKVVEHLPSASQLHEIGLKFRAVKKKGSIHLRFGNGELEMAPFKVYDDIEIHIRNVMAFEQCHYADNHYVSQYMFLLDFLINTDKDVELLVDKGIITNALGDSNAVATMVNSLRKNIITPGVHSHYHEVCCQVNKFYRSRYHRWCTNLRRDYCGTPWKIVGSAAAVLLIVFTFVQTICSVISVS